jgi:hypothetical protein
MPVIDDVGRIGTVSGLNDSVKALLLLRMMQLLVLFYLFSGFSTAHSNLLSLFNHLCLVLLVFCTLLTIVAVFYNLLDVVISINRSLR